MLAGTLPVALAIAQDFVAIENTEVQNVIASDPAGHWTPNTPIDADRPSGMDKSQFLDQARSVTEATIEEGQFAPAATISATPGGVQVDGEDVPEGGRGGPRTRGPPVSRAAPCR